MKRVTIEDAPAVLNMNDRAMWVLGYNELVEKLEGHAIALGRTGPLGRAISVLQDVLTDIEDWEDKALAEAVTDARTGLLMMLEVEKLKRVENPVPRVIASGVTACDRGEPQGCWNVRCQLGKVCCRPVPREPTPAMLEAVKFKAHPTRPNGWGDRAAQLWRLMWDAYVSGVMASHGGQR